MSLSFKFQPLDGLKLTKYQFAVAIKYTMFPEMQDEF